MPSSTETLRDRLTRYRQIKISVIGRKSGKTISILVWFVLEGEKLTCSQCRVRRRGGISTCFITPGFGLKREARRRNSEPFLWLVPKLFSSVVEKFREKYGAKDVKKYYSKFDVAVVIGLDS